VLYAKTAVTSTARCFPVNVKRCFQFKLV
jgi:hypothetical protein